MAYLFMPLAFLIIGYSIIYFAAAPVINTAVSLWQFMQLSAPVSISEEYDDIYNGSTVLGGTVKASSITFPLYGTKYAELEIPSAGIKAPLFFGDGDKELRLGLGQYPGSSFPGTGSTVLVAGHNHTFLHTIDRAAVGDTITVTTAYGVYVYKISDIQIKPSKDTTAYDLTAKKENLVIYTCYPLSTLGLTSKRYFVYAEFLSGPVVLINE